MEEKPNTDKLIPEWGVDGDLQVVLVGLAALLLGLGAFAGLGLRNLVTDDDSTADAELAPMALLASQSDELVGPQAGDSPGSFGGPGLADDEASGDGDGAAGDGDGAAGDGDGAAGDGDGAAGGGDGAAGDGDGAAGDGDGAAGGGDGEDVEGGVGTEDEADSDPGDSTTNTLNDEVRRVVEESGHPIEYRIEPDGVVVLTGELPTEADASELVAQLSLIPGVNEVIEEFSVAELRESQP